MNTQIGTSSLENITTVQPLLAIWFNTPFSFVYFFQSLPPITCHSLPPSTVSFGFLSSSQPGRRPPTPPSRYFFFHRPGVCPISVPTVPGSSPPFPSPFFQPRSTGRLGLHKSTGPRFNGALLITPHLSVSTLEDSLGKPHGRLNKKQTRCGDQRLALFR